MGLLVIGLGNRQRGDDAAGLCVAEIVRRRAPAGLRTLGWCGAPLDLLQRWRSGDSVVVVDAVAPAGSPGALHRFDALADPLPRGIFPVSTHAIGLAETIELGRELRLLPRRLLVVGIEGRGFHAGAPLSPEVRAALDLVAGRVLEETSSW